MIDAPLWLWLTLACTATAAATVAVGQWWFGRRLREFELQQAKLEKARQFAAHQAAQARKQIEKLQLELVNQQRHHAKALTSRQRVLELDIVLGQGDLGIPEPVASEPTAISFSETMPMASA